MCCSFFLRIFCCREIAERRKLKNMLPRTEHRQTSKTNIFLSCSRSPMNGVPLYAYSSSARTRHSWPRRRLRYGPSCLVGRENNFLQQHRHKLSPSNRSMSWCSTPSPADLRLTLMCGGVLYTPRFLMATANTSHAREKRRRSTSTAQKTTNEVFLPIHTYIHTYGAITKTITVACRLCDIPASLSLLPSSLRPYFVPRSPPLEVPHRTESTPVLPVVDGGARPLPHASSSETHSFRRPPVESVSSAQSLLFVWCLVVQ